MTDLALKYGLDFADLYDRGGLIGLDRAFVAHLAAADAALHERLMAARATPDALAHKDESDLIVDLAPHVEDFVGGLFGIEAEMRAMQARHDRLAPLYSVKRLFVQRRAVKEIKEDAAASLDGGALVAEIEALIGHGDENLATRAGTLAWELRYAGHVAGWLDDEAANAAHIQTALRYGAWATLAPEGHARHRRGLLFKVPHRLDMNRLVPVETIEHDGVAMMRLPEHEWRARDGFALTDTGTDQAGALDQANYCIWCHNQGKDSCSTGLREKDGGFKKSVFGVTLAGCPLDEKISEMNLVESRGYSLGALAIVTVDNPLCAATGHRICNDCMKSCIYQRQEPVDIPQVETRVLKDVLALPWGFEIYGLLTRWNPLDVRRPLPKPASGYKVLVVGLGPAGFALTHNLINDGHFVAAIDGLKIEPLPDGIAGDGFTPIRDVGDLYERLDERRMAGFGGVAEYGITVRWDKNFLKLIRLLLERRSQFSMYGGVRFGGTMTIDDAFAMGFDHIALCAGAGRPTVIPMENGLALGVRQASDFLMALQLTGAAKTDSIANLTVRLPVVVIGGGLTAIDTATEALAYYPLQVEKFLSRYEALSAERGAASVRTEWTAPEAEAADEFIAHAKALRAEREAAKKEGRAPRFAPIIDGWGGVTIAYRRRLIDAPSYTLNHEEVAKAMEEGIRFAEGLTPVAVEIDRYERAKGLRLLRLAGEGPANEEVALPARTILVAAGTQPNTVLAREDPDHVMLDGRYFQALDEDGNKVSPQRLAKPDAAHVLMHLDADGRAVSFFGDLHPSFAGNVVKAMGGAKRGYPVVSRVLARRAAAGPMPEELKARLDDELRATVHEVIRLTPKIVEVVVRAPRAARAFQPGQFYRLQNYETYSQRIDGTTLAMEGLALTGAWIDRDRGLLSTIVLEMGGSSDLCALLEPGEPVILMGPTGTPTETPAGETVLLVGGGLGNAVLFSIGAALRAEGSKVLYFAGYKTIEDRYKIEEIERAADTVVWCCDEAPGFAPTRPRDRGFVGNIVQAIEAYGSGALGEISIPLETVDRIIAIGSDGMMKAVGEARRARLKPYFRPGHRAIASINSPMQCMMKEICAQCLQRHYDPVTGTETVVFSCANQDQELDQVDFPTLRRRLSQNGAQEKLTKLWIDRCLKHLGRRQAVEAAE
ncbi:MAG TPA: FAD-dependent oxidoreductase [Stellaceae bacterium]|jgi:NADPH-dependent glutamate synthase beta subunit-like oxidoreductase/NAD(P)H-flavin reductase|nr:FAD-dependent oxidoreductase [Stellaceae bacterium]